MNKRKKNIHSDNNEIKTLVSKLKTKKKLVGLCHGVFDLLHLGHIEHFKECREHCDFLIVSLTSDTFIKKGIGRPYFNESQRQTALEAIKYVDKVIINKEQTSINLIKKIKPSIYFKGKDYKNFSDDKTGNIIKEKNSIESVGGKIYFTSSKKFSSTSLINNFSNKFEENHSLINKIKKQYKFNNLFQNIDEISKKRILLIGEIILDKYSYVEVLGKAGKDPILTFKNINSDIFPGGILAIANNISSFCKKIDVVSYVGDNDNYIENVSKLINKNIKIHKFKKKNSHTIIKTRFIDKVSQNKIMGVYDIDDDPIDLKIENKILKFLDAKTSDYDLVIVADYGHGLLTKKIVDKITAKSKFLSVNTQLNSANFGFHTISKYKKANVLCMHEGELRHDLRMKNDNIKFVIKELSKKIKSEIIFVTKGRKGALAYSNNNFTNSYAIKSSIVDKVGAGDSFFAITSLFINAGLSKEISLLVGNIFGYLSVSSVANSKFINKKDLYIILRSLLT